MFHRRVDVCRDQIAGLVISRFESASAENPDLQPIRILPKPHGHHRELLRG